jgi:hypothetical protein
MFMTTIQGDFLDTPGLTLTLADAISRFAIDRVTCKALLDVLVDARVLCRDVTGAYVRYFPHAVRAA